MSDVRSVDTAALIERVEQSSARAVFRFFAYCGFVLGLAVLVFRTGAALQGVEQGISQAVQGGTAALLSLIAIPFINRGRHKVMAIVFSVFVLLMIAFNLFVMQFGVRAASAPLVCFVLLLTVMVFGLRAASWMLGFCVVLVSVAALAELGGWISGPFGDRFVPSEIYVVCLTLTQLFALGFCIHMDRQAKALNRALEARRAELAAALQDIEHAQGSKERFLKSLSSEVEIPLHAMVQAIEAMQAGEKPAQVEAGGISRMSARVMQFLESALGSARRLSTGGLDLELCSPVQVLQIRCDHWARAAQTKGLTLIQDIDTTFAPACVGPTQLYLDAVNAVLDNAIRYTVQGSVLVRLECLSRDAADAESIAWRLVVSDTGAGISEPVMRRLRIFLRADGQESDLPGSPTLPAAAQTDRQVSMADPARKQGGLVALKRWADVTGGEADILSRMGQGCIVSVSFELRRASAA